MKLYKSVLFLCLLVLQQEVSAIFKLKKVVQAANFWISVLSSVEFLTKIYEAPDKMPLEILNSVNEVSAHLDQLGIQLNQKLDALAISLPKQIRDESRLDRAVEDIDRNIRDINYLYKTYFVNIFNGTVSRPTLEEFISKAISIGGDSPRKMVDNIYAHFRPDETRVTKENLLVTITKILQAKNRTRCDEFQSPRQWLYEIYDLIATVELRVLIMTTSAYKMRSSDNHNSDILSVKEQYVNRMSVYMALMKEAFDLIPDDIRRCDPPHQVKGNTYIELETYSQMVIINAERLSSGRKCQECESFMDRDSSTLRTVFVQKDFGSQCNGHITNCTTWSTEKYWIPRNHQVEVCTMPQQSKRRYLYLISANRQVMGNKTTCPGDVIKDIPYHICPTYSWRDARPVRTCANEICYHCFCTCVQNRSVSSKVPVFDMEPQKTDCASNMVVTGVHMLIDGHNVIRIQIKQGRITAGGRISPGSESWVPLGTATQTLSPSVTRSGIALGDAVTFSSGEYVITGVQFHDSNFQGERVISLKIHAKKYNVTTGMLDCQDSRQYTSELRSNRLAMDLSDSDIPLKSTFNRLDTSTNNFVKFQPSSIRKDVGQTVVPFLDIQEVYTSPPSPLRAIGFYHKGEPGFGGYVGLRIRTMNMGKFIDTERN